MEWPIFTYALLSASLVPLRRCCSQSPITCSYLFIKPSPLHLLQHLRRRRVRERRSEESERSPLLSLVHSPVFSHSSCWLSCCPLLALPALVLSWVPDLVNPKFHRYSLPLALELQSEPLDLSPAKEIATCQQASDRWYQKVQNVGGLMSSSGLLFLTVSSVYVPAARNLSKISLGRSSIFRQRS
jgi:hypothetical protein